MERSGTGNTDRKRLLGHLIEDATLTRDGYEVTIELRMRGGRSLALEKLHLPRPIAQIRKTAPETVAALDQLLNTHTDEAAARELNRMGHRNWKGEPYTAKRLRNTRQVYGLPSYRSARKSGFAMKASAQPRKWLSSSTLRPETVRAMEERETTPASNAESSRPKAGGTACTEPMAAPRCSTRHGKRRRGPPNPHP